MVNNYSLQNKINIDYVIFGHIHSCLISDNYARSSSMCGSNAYSRNRLMYSSKPSQNIYIVKQTAIQGFRIDLQNTDGIQGYQIYKQLCSYNSKYTEQEKNKVIYLPHVMA